MKRLLGIVTPLLGLSLLLTPLAAETSIPGQVAAAVSTPHIAATIRGLSGADPITVDGQTYTLPGRYAYNPEAVVASHWIYGQFANYGLSTSYHDIYSDSGLSDNVVAELPGVVWPDRVFIVSSHYDSINEEYLWDDSIDYPCPGADDNASGTAAVLELARVLSQYQFKSTIRFITFSGEEEGLYGSTDYATDCYQSYTDIRGVLNFDMIAYTGGSDVEDVDIIYQWEQGSELGQIERDMALSYQEHLIANTDFGPERVAQHKYDLGGSDHQPFHENGYPAILVIEAGALEIYMGSNPYYHTADDTFDTLDMDFATAIVRGAAATIADWADPIPIPLTAGDFSGNGVVDYTDYTDLAAAWGSHFGDDNWNPYIDLDADGLIDMGDYVAFASLYGDPGSLPNPLMAPEPATLLLAAGGAVLLLRRRKTA